MTLAFPALLGRLEQRRVYTGAFERRDFVATPANFCYKFEEVTVTTADGVDLFGWALPRDDSERWLVYFHGQGQDISHYLSVTTQLAGLGFNVLTLDYRGYGRSDGVPSEAGLYADASASYDYLLARDVPPENIGLYGYSLGTGVAVDLASQVEVGALVLEAAYTSLGAAAKSLYRILPSGLLRNRFESDLKIVNVTAPTLFVHASDDRLIPIAQGKRLFALSKADKAFLEVVGGHTAMFARPQQPALKKMKGFLEAHLH
ncbi:alpha/beta hydrolase [soil metagenome]